LCAALYRPYGQRDCLALLTPSGSSALLAVALLRARWGFSERERLLLSLLRPHILQARENALVMTDLLGFFGAADEPGAFPHFVPPSAAGRVRQASPRALARLAFFAGTRFVSGDRVPEPVARWVRAEETRLRRSDDAPRAPSPLPLARDGRR